MKKTMQNSLLACLLATGMLVGAPALQAADGHAHYDFELRLTNVSTLAEALKRESAQDGSTPTETLARVEAQTQEARTLAEAGELDVARRVLDEAYKLLAAALAKTKRTNYTPAAAEAVTDARSVEQQRQQAFVRELASTRALLDAYRRLDGGGTHQTDVASLEKGIADAEQAIKEGDRQRGETVLHATYARTKAGIAALEAQSATAKPTSTDSAYPATPTLAEQHHLAERRIQKTRALLDAFQRLGKDKESVKLASYIGGQLKRAAELNESDPQAALVRANEAYSATKIGLQALQKPSAMKTGSAVASKSNASEKARQTEFDNRLKNVRLLRKTLVRLSTERKVNNQEVLARTDRLTAEAQRLAKDSLPLATATIDEAYAAVKQAVIATQAR